MKAVTKNEAIQLLGGSTRKAAQALECSTTTIQRWPDELPRGIADRVIGARVRIEWQESLRGLNVAAREAVLIALHPAMRAAMGAA